MQQVSRETMGQYRPGVSISVPMIRNTNMTSMTSLRPQLNVRVDLSEREEMLRDPSISYTPEYHTMYPQC